MPEYYDRDNRPIRTSAGPQPGISRSGSVPRAAAPRSGARPAPRPQGQRPAGSRPPQGGRPAPRRRRRRVQPRFFIVAAVLIVLIVAAVLIFGGRSNKPVTPQALPTVEPQAGMNNATIVSQTPDPNAPAPLEQPSSDSLVASSVEEEEQDNAPVISSADQVRVADLSINTSLPSEWTNVLLLGTDERTLNEPARTDAMIIASINSSTGEVKLTSLMRDTAVEFNDIGKYSGTYRLNAANYFGGPEYAMKIINECLDMNIQYYASVNFFGFTRIVEALGGIEVDISQGEMEEINTKQRYQWTVAATAGIDESDIENVFLETYGPNTHLNGRQTLAYARVRYVDNDFGRTERQRNVIISLTQKLRGRSAAEILALLTSLAGNVTTNMDLNTIGQIAVTVLSSNLSNIETLHLPKNGTYTVERRNNQEMLYDTDWSKNSIQLYNFIYE